MVKITLGIDGMMCGMCEAHINDAVRSKCKINKIKSSHKKGASEIIAPAEISREELTKVIEETGYRVVSYQSEEYVKKGLFG